jgi:hypothetical protein
MVAYADCEYGHIVFIQEQGQRSAAKCARLQGLRQPLAGSKIAPPAQATPPPVIYNGSFRQI